MANKAEHGALPAPALHSAVHSAPVVTHAATVHHGSHGEGGHGHGYDEQPDPFHFTYGVHDDTHYTDFSESR